MVTRTRLSVTFIIAAPVSLIYQPIFGKINPSSLKTIIWTAPLFSCLRNPNYLECAEAVVNGKLAPKLKNLLYNV